MQQEKAPVSGGLSPKGTSALGTKPMVGHNRPARPEFLNESIHPAFACVLFRSLVMQLLDVGKRRYRGPIERGTIGCELRSVARAIPALLQRVPVHDAAQMRATGRMQMQLSFLV